MKNQKTSTINPSSTPRIPSVTSWAKSTQSLVRRHPQNHTCSWPTYWKRWFVANPSAMRVECCFSKLSTSRSWHPRITHLQHLHFFLPVFVKTAGHSADTKWPPLRKSCLPPQTVGKTKLAKHHVCIKIEFGFDWSEIGQMLPQTGLWHKTNHHHWKKPSWER